MHKREKIKGLTLGLGVDVRCDAFIIVPQAVDRIVPLRRVGGVEVIRDRGVVQPSQRFGGAGQSRAAGR